MIDQNARFEGSIPGVYERCMVPVFFVPYARNLAPRLDVGEGAQVLELACGTGILTRTLLSSARRPLSLTATDLNDAMLELAKQQVRDGDIRWQLVDAANLPFEPASFDAVICQFGVMFFRDKVQAASETRRVLRPGGVYLFNTWGTLTENPCFHIANETIGRFMPEPPTFFPLAFGYHDRQQMMTDLRAGGFREITIETVDLEGRSPSVKQVATGLVQANPGIAAIRERATSSVEDVTAAVAEALTREFGSGDVRFPLRAHVATALP
jgi:SAM-dependent methyltransferase